MIPISLWRSNTDLILSSSLNPSFSYQDVICAAYHDYVAVDVVRHEHVSEEHFEFIEGFMEVYINVSVELRVKKGEYIG